MIISDFVFIVTQLFLIWNALDFVFYDEIIHIDFLFFYRLLVKNTNIEVFFFTAENRIKSMPFPFMTKKICGLVRISIILFLYRSG